MKERQRQLREDAILDATDDLLRSKGYLEMTLDDVIEAVGISKPTLYQHFGSKEDLVTQVALRSCRNLREHLAAADPNLPAGVRLADFVRWILELRFGPHGLCADDLAIHLKRYKKDPSHPLYTEDRRLMADIENLIAAAQKEGAARPDIPPPMLTQTFMSIIRDGHYDEMLADGELTVPQLIESTTQLLMNPAK